MADFDKALGYWARDFAAGYEQDQLKLKEFAMDSYKLTTTPSLAKQMKLLDLPDDERLLRESGLVDRDGTLTHEGADFVLNVLFDDNRDGIVDALKTVLGAQEDTDDLDIE